MFERISDDFYALDEDYIFRYLNDQAKETLGIDESAIGENIREQVFLTESFERALGEAMDTQDPATFEDRYPPADKWFYNAIYPSKRGLSIYFRDITERKQRERELERALDLLHATERTANVGGWEINPDTMAVFWTEHLFDILEFPGDKEPSFDQALDVYHEDDRQIVADAVEQALDTGDPFDVEARFYTPSGDLRWLRV